MHIKAPGLRSLASKSNPQRITADMATALPSLSDPADLAVVVAIAADRTDEDTARHEALELLRRSHYETLGALLTELAQDTTDGQRFRAFAVQHLGVITEDPATLGRDALLTALRELQHDASTSVRREAFGALVRAQDAQAIASLDQPLSDARFLGMRDLAIRCLVELKRSDRKDEVRALITDSDEDVRIQAMVAAGAWNDVAAREVLEAAAKAAPSRSQRAAQMALTKLK